eukprot:SAG11_NODE_4684_length_1807_cov_1.466628_1_plen_38_part_10
MLPWKDSWEEWAEEADEQGATVAGPLPATWCQSNWLSL